MSEEVASHPPTTPAPNPPDSIEDQALARLWFEIAVVVCLMWLPAMFSSVASHAWPVTERTTPFVYDMLFQIVSAIQISAPILYIMWRSNDGWAHFGIKPIRPLADLGATIAVLALSWIVWFAYWQVFAGLYIDSLGGERSPTMDMFAKPTRPVDLVILMIGCLGIGITEELSMRAFLLPRLEALLRSPAKAVCVSALIFASYHAYQHPIEMGSVLAFGLVFGAAFCLVRRIWPLIVAHAVWDVWSYLGAA